MERANKEWGLDIAFNPEPQLDLKTLMVSFPPGFRTRFISLKYGTCSGISDADGQFETIGCKDLHGVGEMGKST